MRRRTTRTIAAALAGLVASVALAAPAQAETVRQAQWHLDALHVLDAQKISTGAGVIVGVVDDTGVDNTHPDLAGQILPGTGIRGAPANGWSNADQAAHATGVAGIIAGKGGGPDHLLGIAPGVKILPVGLPDTDHRTLDDMATGIRWAVDHGAKVINLSVGAKAAPSPAEVDAVRYAIAKDVVIVAAAGNIKDAGPAVQNPASIPGVLAVAGTDRNVDPWSGSASGPEVGISAPSVDIAITVPTAHYASGYGKAEGTSAAAPIVTGAAALIRAKYPNLNAASVINRLIKTAKDQDPPGRDQHYGYGTVRIVDALTANVPTVTANPLGAPPAPSASGAAATNGSTHTGGLRGEAIAVIVGAAVVLLLLALVIALIVMNRRGRRRAANTTPMPAYPGPTPGAYPSTPPSYPPGQPPPPPPTSGPIWPPRPG